MGLFDYAPGPDRLVGEEWIEHGYQASPSFLVPEECPICGSPDGTCTDATHRFGMALQQDELNGIPGQVYPVYQAPPSDEPDPIRGYVPGSNPTAEAYDIPEGSQSEYDPDANLVPSADSNQTLYGNDEDPEFAYSNSPLNPDDPSYVQLAGTDFDEEDGYITLPYQD